MKKLLFIFTCYFFSTAIVVSAQSFDDFGKAHNDYLKEILPHIDGSFNSENSLAKVSRVVKENLGFSYEMDKISSLTQFGEPIALLNEIRDKGIVEKEVFETVERILLMIENNSLEEVLSIVEIERMRNNDNETVLNFLSTLKHSALFWSSKEYKNWLDVDIDMDGETDNPQGRLSRKFWKCVLCDAAGAIITLNPVVGSVCTTVSTINNYF